MTAQTNKRILITGAAGQIGDAVRKGLRGSYPLIRSPTSLLSARPSPARKSMRPTFVTLPPWKR